MVSLHNKHQIFVADRDTEVERYRETEKMRQHETNRDRERGSEKETQDMRNRPSERATTTTTRGTNKSK